MNIPQEWYKAEQNAYTIYCSDNWHEIWVMFSQIMKKV